MEDKISKLNSTQKLNNQKELATANSFMNKKIEDLKDIENSIKSNNSLKTLVQVLSSDLLQETELFNKDTNAYLLNYKDLKNIDLEVNPNFLNIVSNEINNYLTLVFN